MSLPPAPNDHEINFFGRAIAQRCWKLMSGRPWMCNVNQDIGSLGGALAAENAECLEARQIYKVFRWQKSVGFSKISCPVKHGVLSSETLLHRMEPRDFYRENKQTEHLNSMFGSPLCQFSAYPKYPRQSGHLIFTHSKI